MKRRDFLKRAGIGTAAGAAIFAAEASAYSVGAQQVAQWRMAADSSRDDSLFFEGAVHIARRVAELTDGKFQIRVSAAGEIVDAAQVIDAVRAGTVEIGHVSLDGYVEREPAFAFAAGLPFGLDDRRQAAWLAAGGREMLEPVFPEYGLIGIRAGGTGAQIGAWSRKEIRCTEDLKGMKFGTGGLAALLLTKLGAEPQSLADDEVRPALEKGALDAVQWIGPHDDEQRGFHRIAGYYYYPGLSEAGQQVFALVNFGKWRELPRSHQAALEAACGEAAALVSAQYDTKNPQALRRLLQQGVQLRPLPQSVLQAAAAASIQLHAELGAKSAHFRRIHAHWQAFRDEQEIWARLAQGGFDSFAYAPHGGPAAA